MCNSLGIAFSVKRRASEQNLFTDTRYLHDTWDLVLFDNDGKDNNDTSMPIANANTAAATTTTIIITTSNTLLLMLLVR